MLRKYYSLTKPGVLYGNVITGVAGYLFGAVYFDHFNAGRFIAAIGGMTLVIASACVINNVLDQDIDAKMERTKTRAVAAGEIKPLYAVIFSIILGAAGVAILAAWVSWLVVGIGAGGFVVYVWLYGAFSKRRSIHGTLVGSLSGATPILAGYCAVSGRVDAGGLLVFLALFFWQFPEFYSIAIYRRREYQAAGVPVITVVRGVPTAKRWIFICSIGFVASSLALTAFGYTGWLYFAVMALAGTYWLKLGWAGQKLKQSDGWARQMFHISLLILMLYSAMLPIGAWAP